mmetsp:Transcript_10175/g.35139  ORF Transcript_10175/g.35139 Transcript_10175/m.35139 type:complete len:472 (+) Transcript_10175:4521-5936(+)
MGDNGEKGASGKCFGRRESGRRARARVAGSRSETNLKDGLVGVALGDDSESLEDSRQDQHNDVGSRANEDEEALDDVSGIRGELARQDEPAPNGPDEHGVVNHEEKRLCFAELLGDVPSFPGVHGTKAGNGDLVGHDHDREAVRTSDALDVTHRTEGLLLEVDLPLDRIDNAVDQEQERINHNGGEPVHQEILQRLGLHQNGVVEDVVDSPGLESHGHEGHCESQADDDGPCHAKVIGGLARSNEDVRKTDDVSDNNDVVELELPGLDHLLPSLQEEEDSRDDVDGDSNAGDDAESRGQAAVLWHVFALDGLWPWQRFTSVASNRGAVRVGLEPVEHNVLLDVLAGALTHGVPPEVVAASDLAGLEDRVVKLAGRAVLDLSGNRTRPKNGLWSDVDLEGRARGGRGGHLVDDSLAAVVDDNTDRIGLSRKGDSRAVAVQDQHKGRVLSSELLVEGVHQAEFHREGQVWENV